MRKLGHNRKDKQRDMSFIRDVSILPVNPSRHSVSQGITVESEITSSMLLQQLMYYNVYYSIIQVYLYLASQVYRWLYLNLGADREYNVPVRFILLAIFIPLEYFRLLNGFSGNLRETVRNSRCSSQKYWPSSSSQYSPSQIR